MSSFDKKTSVAVTSVLANSNMMPKIASYLTFPDMESARFVNRVFHKFTTRPKLVNQALINALGPAQLTSRKSSVERSQTQLHFEAYARFRGSVFCSRCSVLLRFSFSPMPHICSDCLWFIGYIKSVFTPPPKETMDLCLTAQFILDQAATDTERILAANCVRRPEPGIAELMWTLRNIIDKRRVGLVFR